MNFAKLHYLVQEAKFTAPTTVRSIDSVGLHRLLGELCTKAFGHENVKVRPANVMGYRGVAVIVGNRIFNMSVNDRPKYFYINNQEKLLPSIYVSFGWLIDPPSKDRSQKDPANDDGYEVMKTLQRDTLIATHKLRDLVFRKLSEYAIGITYVAVGERRENLYASILSSSGFTQLENGDTFVSKALAE